MLYSIPHGEVIATMVLIYTSMELYCTIPVHCVVICIYYSALIS